MLTPRKANLSFSERKIISISSLKSMSSVMRKAPSSDPGGSSALLSLAEQVLVLLGCGSHILEPAS